MTEKTESEWQRSKGREFLREERQIRHLIRKLIVQNARGGTVLDVGCASCIDYPYWNQAGVHYTGLDLTPKFLEYAESLYPGIELVEADAADIPIIDGGVCTSYCKDVLEHLPPERVKSVMSEMWRVCSQRMMIAFYIPPTNDPEEIRFEKGHYFNRYNRGQVEGLIRGMRGFKSLEVIENVGYNNSALYIADREPQ